MSQTSQYSPVKYLELKQPEFSYNPAFYTDGFGAGLYPVSKWDSRKTDISPSEKRLKHFFFFFFSSSFFFFSWSTMRWSLFKGILSWMKIKKEEALFYETSPIPYCWWKEFLPYMFFYLIFFLPMYFKVQDIVLYVGMWWEDPEFQHAIHPLQFTNILCKVNDNYCLQAM